MGTLGKLTTYQKTIFSIELLRYIVVLLKLKKTLNFRNLTLCLREKN